MNNLEPILEQLQPIQSATALLSQSISERDAWNQNLTLVAQHLSAHQLEKLLKISFEGEMNEGMHDLLTESMDRVKHLLETSNNRLFVDTFQMLPFQMDDIAFCPIEVPPTFIIPSCFDQ
jgi:hypothetical protein